MKKINKYNLIILTGLFLNSALCQNITTPDQLTSYQTVHSIGIEWNINGDDNHNAQCNVNYRVLGNEVFKPALPLFRIDFNGFNMFAGSILFLEEDTNYEIQLELLDSDGGNESKILTIKTRSYPKLPVAGNTYFVSPGNGGGIGTSDNPFLGIDEAQNMAAPGDIFLLNSGFYSGEIEFTVSGNTDNYIVWKANEEAVPKFERARVSADYVWLEGITVENQDYALLTSDVNPTGVVIKGNYFYNCNYSINLNHGGENWYITDNTIEGDITDFTTGEMSGEGVELEHSDGHVVAYNRISNAADGVSYPGKNCDIFRNEIFNVSDDGIEFDYGYANNRAWENRITTANNNGISFQPMYSAPAYVVRNQVIVVEEDVIKLRDNVDRVLLANNTFVCQSGPVSNSTHFLTGFQSNNNLYISVNDRYAWEDGNSSTQKNWRTNLDYDGFDWNDNIYAFKWANNRLETLEELQSNYQIELNGIRVRKDEIFNSYSFPASPSPAPLQYLTLKEGCNAIDAGIALNNINENFTGEAPDLGAFEFGIDVLEYGPRENNTVNVSTQKTVTKDFSLSQNYPNPFNPSTMINYQIPMNSNVNLKIFDILGREVITLVNEHKPAGSYTVEWNGTNSAGKQVGNSVYFYQLKASDGFVETKKMLLLR